MICLFLYSLLLEEKQLARPVNENHSLRISESLFPWTVKIHFRTQNVIVLFKYGYIQSPSLRLSLGIHHIGDTTTNNIDYLFWNAGNILARIENGFKESRNKKVFVHMAGGNEWGTAGFSVSMSHLLTIGTKQKSLSMSMIWLWAGLWVVRRR